MTVELILVRTDVEEYKKMDPKDEKALRERAKKMYLMSINHIFVTLQDFLHILASMEPL